MHRAGWQSELLVSAETPRIGRDPSAEREEDDRKPDREREQREVRVSALS
jgi:hypothetical protein